MSVELCASSLDNSESNVRAAYKAIFSIFLKTIFQRELTLDLIYIQV